MVPSFFIAGSVLNRFFISEDGNKVSCGLRSGECQEWEKKKLIIKESGKRSWGGDTKMMQIINWGV